MVNWENSENKKFKFKDLAFLFGISSIAFLSGFSYSIGSIRKKDPEIFDKKTRQLIVLHRSGSSLALKALGIGSIFALSGVGFICGAVWKISGASNMQDFRRFMGNAFPKIPKNDPPKSRTEFESLTDFLQYVVDNEKYLSKTENLNTDESNLNDYTNDEENPFLITSLENDFI